jgi:hypothetical protein
MQPLHQGLVDPAGKVLQNGGLLDAPGDHCAQRGWADPQGRLAAPVGGDSTAWRQVVAAAGPVLHMTKAAAWSVKRTH